MGNFKKVLGTGTASLVLAGALALPAAAQQSTDCTGGTVSSNVCPNINVDNSRTRTTTLGNCSAIINNDVDQEQAVVAATEQTNAGVAVGAGEGGDGRAQANGPGDDTAANAGGAGTGVGSNEQSNSANTSATGTQSNTINFTPNCSTNNNVTHVTNQMMAAAQVAHPGGHGSGAGASSSSHGGFGSGEGELVAQVSAPAGGVSAGAGGAVASSATSIFGLVSSLAATTAGVVFRKKMML